MLLYAYCLSDAVTPSVLEGLKGIGGVKPRLLRCGEIYAVVCDFDGDTVSVTRENVFAHERVIERVLATATPLPFRFSTLVSAGRLEAFVNENLDTLRERLRHVRDAVEMSVKILWDVAGQRSASAHLFAAVPESESGNAGRGAAYLQARRREILGDELLQKRAEELAAWLAHGPGGAAKDSIVRVGPTESLVIRAAFLVRRSDVSDYQERLEAARRERPGLRFLTSGPWPPYSFCNIKP
jgi:hypothetical protein